MARVAEIIKNILLICTNIVPQLEIVAFIEQLDESDTEKNYKMFSVFAEKKCSSSLLGVLYRLGHCRGGNNFENSSRECPPDSRRKRRRRTYKFPPTTLQASSSVSG